MPKAIEVDEQTYLVITVAAQVAGRTPGEVVRRLLTDATDRSSAAGYGEKSPPQDPALAHLTKEIGIYAFYLRRRIEAVLDPVRETVRITSGPLAGELFDSPSAAGIKLVETLNPNRQF